MAAEGPIAAVEPVVIVVAVGRPVAVVGAVAAVQATSDDVAASVVAEEVAGLCNRDCFEGKKHLVD